MPHRDDQPNDQFTPSDVHEVSSVPAPEQPPMIDEDDEDTVEETSTDDLAVQGGE